MAEPSIAALATAEGRSALALVRVSGHDAFDIAGRLVSPWPLEPRRATLCEVRHPESGALLDEAVVTAYVAPHSYTGENAIEIATHGGRIVPASVLSALVAAGARQALPGEFTRRAVLNGRLDLVQAEAVGDLIDARSSAMQQAAIGQMSGLLSRRIAEVRDALLGIDALLAYDIDFPEEDDGPVPRSRIENACRRTILALEALMATAPAGALLRDGAVVVIAGPPNAGKSSLFNALLGEERAIVTEIAGTTRDAIEAVLDTQPWPLRLVDTAGLRESSDVVERLGIEVSERYLRSASVVVACGASEAEAAATAQAVCHLTEAPVVTVRTKSDLAQGSNSSSLAVSAVTGDGLRELIALLQHTLAGRHHLPASGQPMVTRARHLRAIATARDELAAFDAAWSEGELPAPVAAVHVRAAAGALEELIGAVDMEEVLGRVFGEFCVGK